MDNYKLKFENGRTCTIDCDSTQSFQDKINDAEKRFNSECCEINGKPIKKHSLGGFLVGATIGAILGNSVPEKTISKTATGVKRTAKNVAKKVQKEVKKFSGGGNTSKEPYFEEFWSNQMLPYFVKELKKILSKTTDPVLKTIYLDDIGFNIGLSGNFIFTLKSEYNYDLTIRVIIDTNLKVKNSDVFHEIKEWESTFDNIEEVYGFEGDKPIFKAIENLCLETSKKFAPQIYALKSEKFSGGGSTDNEKYCRKADDTGKGINEGYVVGDGEMYFETEKGLLNHLRDLDWEDADGNSSKDMKTDEDLKEFFYNEDYYYYTEWEADEEIKDQGFYFNADGKEIYPQRSKPNTTAKAPRSWNKDVREYMFFVFNTRSNKVWAGNEYEGDAKDELKEFLLDNPKLPLKVLSKRAITNKKINPLAWENWARNTEIFAEIRGENPEQMAKGSKVKSSTNDARIKALVKDLENTPYSIGLAILRERVLTYSENDLKSLEKNPKKWENPIISLGMYKDYYSRVNKALSFEPRKLNTKAVKDLVKDLENTPYSIGLVILRERLYAYAENDLKAMKKNPDDWSNPFISLGMYQDYANRVIENLKFDYEAGGELGSLALAGASPQLAIASEVSKIAPATTSALDRRIASQIDPDRPKWYEDRGNQYGKGGILDDYQEEMFQEWLEDGNVIQVEKGVYATQDAQYRNRIKGMDGLRKYVLKEFWSDSSYAKGGKVGDNITFRHWAGDIQKGSINEDLGDGNFDVSSGFGRVLVNREDIISVDKEPIERKKLFGLFENGGSTGDEFENKIFWVMTLRKSRSRNPNAHTQYQVMRGDYMTQFIYSNKAEAEAKARLLNSKTHRN